MFKRLTQKERLQMAEAENKALQAKVKEQEDALLELASLLSKEATHGENLSEEN